MPLQSALNAGVKLLQQADIDSAWLDAELLMAQALKKDRVFIATHPDHPITALQSKRFFELITQRKRRYPLAYLTGYKEFYGLNFIVTPDVLVPRPESELMVELALKYIDKNTLVIDVGTGSGCIAVSIAKRSHVPVVGLDISPKALSVARKNSRKYNLKNISFRQSDLLAKLPSLAKYKRIIITANLPYVSTKLMEEPSIRREPKLALHGGKDGLDLYRKLRVQLEHIKDKEIILLCEINPEQKAAFKKIFPDARFEKDLAGKTRLGIVI